LYYGSNLVPETKSTPFTFVAAATDTVDPSTPYVVANLSAGEFLTKMFAVRTSLETDPSKDALLTAVQSDRAAALAL